MPEHVTGAQLRAEREEADFSREELASRSDRSVKTLQRIEQSDSVRPRDVEAYRSGLAQLIADRRGKTQSPFAGRTNTPTFAVHEPSPTEVDHILRQIAEAVSFIESRSPRASDEEIDRALGRLDQLVADGLHASDGDHEGRAKLIRLISLSMTRRAHYNRDLGRPSGAAAASDAGESPPPRAKGSGNR